MTSLFAISHESTAKGESVFRSIRVVDRDIDKFVKWNLAHQKGRDFVKKTFGEVYFEWENKNKPMTDFPSSGNPGGIFSEKAVKALLPLLEQYGDLHHITMESGESYFLYDCWSLIDCSHVDIESPWLGGWINSITIATNIDVPEVFGCRYAAGLLVGENFKNTAESAGLTGMVFSPVEIVFSD